LRLAGGDAQAQMAPMDLRLTVILLVVSLAATGFAGWRGARPPDVVKGPRMIPWRFLMVLFAALTFLLLVHLGTLGGAPRPGPV
jgi:hypothetical protein